MKKAKDQIILSEEEIENLAELYQIIKSNKIFLSRFPTFGDLINYHCRELDYEFNWILRLATRTKARKKNLFQFLKTFQLF